MSGNLSDFTDRKNMLLLIQLRWIAVIGQIVTIEFAFYGLGIDLPVRVMLVALSILLAFNVVSLLRWRTRRTFSHAELFVSLLVDVAVLTAQLYLSGGASNPFVFLYLLQVTLGAVLLRPYFVWSLFAITAICFAALAGFADPLTLPPDHDRGLTSLYIQGTLICFVLNAVLLVMFITRINKNLRQQDARLAGLRQRAAEEEHIVRMGLLASGAAHELGTPLATLAVILFMADLVEEWRHTRVRAALHYDNQLLHDLPVVSDSAVKQMIFNVLDNALESSGEWLSLSVARDADDLVLRCTDKGPGFAAATLAQLGKPYNSSKGRPGGGLGLFLVVNVARTLGGVVTAANQQEGGACVTIRLPLAAMLLGSGIDEDSREY